MTPDLREYKTQSCNQLLKQLPQLEARLPLERDAANAKRLQKQIEAIYAHVDRLRHELETDTALPESVADELCRKAARALVKQKFFLAQKCLYELETIEPFYPNLNRLKEEATSQKIGRQTRSIAEGTASPFVLPAVMPTLATKGHDSPTPLASATGNGAEWVESPPWWRNIFQFHIMASCAVVMFLFCMMAMVSSSAILQFIFEGRY